jgi:Cys-rich protein (TIGR01571 family)
MPEFQQGLFGCFSNCCVCVITYFAPCYTEGKIAEKVGESCLLHGCLIFVPVANIICGAMIREKVRQNKGIDGTFVKDCLTIWCCFACALCQEANEVDALGKNMAVSMARE